LARAASGCIKNLLHLGGYSKELSFGIDRRDGAVIKANVERA